MLPESSQWIIPAPLRTLLWWPLIAFVVAMVQPTSAPMIITAAGVGLALLGAVHAAIRSLSRDHINLSPTAAATSPLNPTTMQSTARGATVGGAVSPAAEDGLVA